MARYLILAQSDFTANALGAWLELLGDCPLPNAEDPRRILYKPPPGPAANVVEAYAFLVSQIEKSARDGATTIPLNEIVVLVDSVRPSALNAVAEGGSWDSIVAMLILTFPEIRWVFGVTSDAADACWNKIQRFHSLVAILRSPKRDPIFDPSELRQWVRRRVNQNLEGVDDLRLAERVARAASIDEERRYAYFHGYTAYRFGYCADVVTTWTLMKDLFRRSAGSGDSDAGHGYDLLLEDMSLNFPDREGHRHLLLLANRAGADNCPRLDSMDSSVEKAKVRVLVTTGQDRPGGTALEENRAYLSGKAVGKGKVVFKPASGMFALWDDVGLLTRQPRGLRRGYQEEFNWPPGLSRTVSSVVGHGAPGKLLMVAEALVRRAEALEANVKCVEDAVQGAVLATDALELTACRTPTMATDALALKHRMEVMGECQFSGVEYQIAIAPRLREIGDDARVISQWFHRSERTNAKFNVEMGIAQSLVGIFRSHFQFDEEQACMNRVRHLHNTLWVRRKPSRVLLLPLLRYLELLLSSVGVFVAVLLSWIVGLSFLFWLTNTHAGADWGHGLSDAVSAFFSAGAPVGHEMTPTSDNAGWRYLFVVCLAIVTGFIHLGVFISHLYSITSKR